MRTYPKIRIKGFTDPWEQRKLGDLVERITRKNGNLESNLPLTISAQYGLIDQNEFFDKRIASKDVSGYYLIKKGEFAYNKSTSNDAEWGAIKRLDRYEKGVLSTLYIVFKIVNEEKTSSDFLVSYYETNLWHKGIQSIAAEGARNHGLLNIASKDFFETSLNVPSNFVEQQMVGSFFKSLDILITLNQRKCESLKLVKKSFLEKLFPKDGEIFPELRFKSFTDPWEQRKLKDIANKVTTKNSGTLYVETLTNSAEFGIISQKDFFDHNISNLENIDGYYIVENNDFVYNPRISTSAPVGPINRNKLGRSGVMSPLYSVFRTHDVDEEYVEWFFKSSKWHKFMFFNGDTGARSDRFAIKDSVFFEMPIPIPHIDEQRKIGHFFSNLDSLITLHQRKCDALKNAKKYFLHNMFV